MRAALAFAAAAVAAALATGGGLVNYDTAYLLVWGRDLAAGRLPDAEVALAPTRHPLGELWGLLTAPLPVDGAIALTLVLAFTVLGALGWVTYTLGRAWFGPAAGALAAAIVLTRRPILDFGARAYVDLPYLVLVLGALLVETRRPRAGTPVLVLLGAAGLLRPEAWLFAGLYALWLRTPKALVLAAAAPAIWALTDLLLTGDPLFSLTGTRENAATLQRITGLDDVPLTAPRRLGEILREPVLLAVALAAIPLWPRRHERALRLGALTAVVAFAAFCALAAAGLPILGRYLLPVAVLLAIAGAGAITGPRWARAVVAVALLAFVPAQIDRIASLRRALERQGTIQADLRSALDATRRCAPITVPNHRPRPLVALWFDVRPRAVLNAQDTTPRAGTFARPATRAVADDYVLDPRDRDRSIAQAPPGFAPAARNASWRILARCR